ncbi:integration host factor subunit alpha [Roseovarius mucosus]|uniref:Integration host factor subunit alpha n=1 Tax=Roseovarius mucosus TaxID=215743 RepID=A0A1V0RTU9_9RHOB|nr:HU family DNA-binding protein [Roseovarius mucosus]ARE85169.1 integration host factor subunit alpha [Roseovarius mucosus]
MTTKAKTKSPRKTTTRTTTKTGAAKPRTTRKVAPPQEAAPEAEIAVVAETVSAETDTGNVITLAVAEAIPTDSGPELKKQELIDKVLAKGDIKKKNAKPVVEAVLEVLGEVLAEGREINLPPLGKIKINRVRDMANARIIIAKIRQAKPGAGPDTEADDDDSDEDMKEGVAQGEE